MKDREKILRYFSATGEEAKDMAIRLLDIADSVDRGKQSALSCAAPLLRERLQPRWPPPRLTLKT